MSQPQLEAGLRIQNQPMRPPGLSRQIRVQNQPMRPPGLGRQVQVQNQPMRPPGLVPQEREERSRRKSVKLRADRAAGRAKKPERPRADSAKLNNFACQT